MAPASYNLQMCTVHKSEIKITNLTIQCSLVSGISLLAFKIHAWFSSRVTDTVICRSSRSLWPGEHTEQWAVSTWAMVGSSCARSAGSDRRQPPWNAAQPVTRDVLPLWWAANASIFRGTPAMSSNDVIQMTIRYGRPMIMNVFLLHCRKETCIFRVVPSRRTSVNLNDDHDMFDRKMRAFCLITFDFPPTCQHPSIRLPWAAWHLS